MLNDFNYHGARCEWYQIDASNISFSVNADKTTVSYKYNQNHALPSRTIKNKYGN